MTRSLVIGASRSTVLDTVQQQAKKIVNAAQRDSVSTKNRFVYFAAFDGSNNDLENQGSDKNTNVAQLWIQFERGIGKTRPNIHGRYFPGPGAKGTLDRSSWESGAVNEQVRKTAEEAYEDFAARASKWLKKKKPGASVTTVLTSFSRGVASAVIFSQMLHERGLVAPDKEVLIAPGQVTVSAGVNFDPVATGVKGNLAFAPSVRNIVNIRAQDEYRQVFMAVDYSAQSCVRTVPMLGNHCDIGGGYENDGIAALTLEAATAFLKNSGLPIGPVAATRKFDGRLERIAIHSEDGDEGEIEKYWNVYAPGPEILSFYVDDSKKSPRRSDPKATVTPAAGEVTADRSAGKKAAIARPKKARPKKVAKATQKSNRGRKRR